MTGPGPKERNFEPDLSRYFEQLPKINTIKQHGRVSKIVGLIIESEGPAVMMGEMCLIVNPRGGIVRSEVVGFKDRPLSFQCLLLWLVVVLLGQRR